MNKRSFTSMFKEVGPVLSLGILGGVCVALGLLFGWLLDTWLRIQPWGMAVGIFWGIGAAVFESYKLLSESVKKFENRKNDDKKD
jgi:F0F1-type ATP synthase assembly protein I